MGWPYICEHDLFDTTLRIADLRVALNVRAEMTRFGCRKRPRSKASWVCFCNVQMLVSDHLGGNLSRNDSPRRNIVRAKSSMPKVPNSKAHWMWW